MEAPERIYLHRHLKQYPSRNWSERAWKDGENIEYIRADIAEAELARLREEKRRIQFTPMMCRNLIDAFGGEPLGDDVGDVVVEWHEAKRTWIAYVEEYPNDGVLDLCRDYRLRAAAEGGVA